MHTLLKIFQALNLVRVATKWGTQGHTSLLIAMCVHGYIAEEGGQY